MYEGLRERHTYVMKPICFNHLLFYTTSLVESEVGKDIVILEMEGS